MVLDKRKRSPLNSDFNLKISNHKNRNLTAMVSTIRHRSGLQSSKPESAPHLYRLF
ncbi:hypothetical protein P4H71_10890 [Paenibacillus kribbensis]|uniref:hypothetical protein n=1 Tax=Paenibacillus kribbensis TaxID=172713 RepID=UPI002DBE5112|nr:hypothetical protein [Paenibacillus kribbensis]MEC0234833.1 hypothetical protein [Paenibacillus kribbensis]